MGKISGTGHINAATRQTDKRYNELNEKISRCGETGIHMWFKPTFRKD